MRLAAALAAGWLLGGCAATQPPLRSGPLELTGVPFFPQTEYQCGPAALATVLVDSGIPVEPGEITEAVYIPDRKGSLQVELVAAARRFGRVPFVLEPDREAVLAELEAGRPVLVLQNLAFERFPKWHYSVVVGYLPDRNRFVLRSGRNERKLERAALFLRSWRLAERWAFVVLDAGELPASATPDAWARNLAASEQRLAAEMIGAGYEAGLARWPDNPLLLFASANFLFGSGETTRAASLYRRLLAVDPEHAAGRNNLANLLLGQGCTAQARAEIDRALAAMDEDDPLRPAVEDTASEIDAADASRRCEAPGEL